VKSHDFYYFFKKIRKFFRDLPINHAILKLSEDCIYKNIWFQTYFSQYQTALDKVRCFISFKSNIHNMNGIFLAIAFTA
jgi:hypothetical protein